jgi:PAS domain S-box-containing protein
MPSHSVKSTSLAFGSKTVSSISGIFVMLIGILVLIGWGFDVADLKSIYAGITMKANTALALVVAGTSLALLNVDRGNRLTTKSGQVLAILLAVIGVLTLSEHLTGINLHIDEILFTEAPGALATTSPGRMGVTASSCFTMSGIALLFFYRRRAISVAQLLSAIVGLWGLLSIIGYAYKAEQLYGIARYSGIALHTAVALFVLSFGLLAAQIQSGIVSIFSEKGAGGMMARRLLFTAITVPFVFGWLVLTIQRTGYADLGFGSALLVVSLIVILAGVSWHSALLVSYFDTQQANEIGERKRAERSLAIRAREQAALYQLTARLNRAESLTDVYKSALDAIMDALRCDRASLLLFDDTGVMRFAGWRQLSDAYRSTVEGHSPWKQDEPNAQVISISDVEAADLEDSLKTALGIEGTRALAFIPLIVRGALIGKFTSYYNVPRIFTDEELALAQTISGQIGFGIERERAKDERRRAERAQALLAGIVESSGDAIISKTLDGVILSWNGAAERLFGYTAEEAIDQHISIIIPPERMDEEQFILQRLRQGDSLDHFETIRRSKSGQRLHISLTVSPVRNDDGKVVGASKIARDISARKRVEAALREREQRFRTLADASPVMVWMAGPDRAGNYFNQRWRAFTGRSMEDEIRSDWAERVHPDDLQRVVAAYNTSFDARQEFEMEYRLRRSDGEYRWIVDRGLPLFTSPDEFIGYIDACLDITERKRAEQEREQLLQSAQDARAEAESANRIKDEFLATLSHELRTPLNAIMGWSSLLQTKKLDEEGNARAIETISRNARAQARLIDDILDMSRIVSGNIRLESRPVDLSGVVGAAIDAVRPAADAKDIELTRILNRDAALVLGDAGRLQQVVWNLLSNAVKFTEPSGHVKVQLRARDSNVEIIVKDDGQGIRADFLPHVFDRFRQADGSITRKQKGLGLGLAIVRNLVEMQGGTVRAESGGAGAGSTFTVALPALTVGADVRSVHREGRAVEHAYASLALAGLRILVVDDEADAHEMLAAVLSNCEAHVRTATSAAEAMALLTEWEPDVLISDIQMPETDGFTFIRQLRAREAKDGVHLPAIALTAHAKAEDRLRSLEAGFQLHVSKPVDLKELALAVATLTGRVQRRRL